VIKRLALLGVQMGALLLVGALHTANASEIAYSDDGVATVTVVGTGVSNMDAANGLPRQMELHRPGAGACNR
jgi:hypothetical protein